MRRRDFIAAIGGVTAWPVVARAQQPGQMRRIGVLMGQPGESDPIAKGWLAAFFEALARLGWVDGRTVRIDIRWSDTIERAALLAKELVNLRPDVILAYGRSNTAALQRETPTIPIVFTLVANAVESGLVASLNHPGANITGFIATEGAIAGKWLELLTEIAPGLKRAALVFNPDPGDYVETYFLPHFQAAARLLKVAAIAAPVHNDAEIEAVITSLAREPGGGFVGSPDGFLADHREVVLSLAARNNVPAVYGSNPDIVRDGGLLFYGSDGQDEFRRSASYVDRILRGAKPADLPVQLPVKFVMAVNIKTAKALGLTVPPSIWVRADEVIE